MLNRTIHLICRLILPEHVISLSLSGNFQLPNKLTLLLSLIPFEGFTRLHSLYLASIKDETHNKILRHVNTITLTSFSFSSSSVFTKATMVLLSSTPAKNSLLKQHLAISTMASSIYYRKSYNQSVH
ncbi:unnamed protein product [Rotaria magnacalcarata]|uniref:Uncharacterized protein n=1 Tax=Rotaria magnacalcarata TaxID=392030 RepID=A0A816T1Q1_9BILA|nr:unnamed protein product [Rotaria magnacalcarata]